MLAPNTAGTRRMSKLEGEITKLHQVTNLIWLVLQPYTPYLLDVSLSIYLILFPIYLILSYLILFYLMLSYRTIYLILSYPILSYPIYLSIYLSTYIFIYIYIDYRHTEQPKSRSKSWKSAKISKTTSKPSWAFTLFSIFLDDFFLWPFPRLSPSSDICGTGGQDRDRLFGTFGTQQVEAVGAVAVQGPGFARVMEGQGFRRIPKVTRGLPSTSYVYWVSIN